MRRFWKLGFISMLAILFILAGCGGGSTDSSSSSEGGSDSSTGGSEAGTDTEENRTLTVAMGTDMVSFDIHDHNNTSTEAIHINVFNYLFKGDENKVLSGDLVEYYDLVDNTTWEFRLKPDVTFHNGDPLTAEDVKFTLERVATDSSLREYPNYRQILEVNVIDELNFQIITDGPQPALLNRLSRIGSGILPKNYIEENGWDHFLSNPIGSGPYKFVEWMRDDRVVFEAHEDYWEGDNQEWDRLVFRVIPEASTRVAELLTGGVDIAMNVPPNEWDRINGNDGTNVIVGDANRVIMLTIRQTEGLPTSDPRVVEAIDLAINNEAITEHILGGAGTPTRTRVTPGNFGANESLFNTYLYDLERAKELMAEAGYADGFDITFQSPHGRYLQDREVAEIIVSMLSEININASLEFMEWSNFVEMRNSKTNKEIYMIGFGNSMFDADLAVDLYQSDRAAGETDYNDSEVDELIAAARVNMDPIERAEQYERIQEIIAEGRPHIYLHQEKSNYGVGDRIDFTPRIDEMLIVDDITRK
ncbi:ABC transporter substrate-binding protein [Bacillus horti]|uniref:Peptide/nickel transport system substrate-binding protein n=1 Tax=Caldalkalibacillus horti TaxID=77523 RepID=A0ABT9W2N7_9BACI|nr:ABC transporter substrate-binding protein [Bacillus horti]MDQ0167390.1 peptide/nickel transport system substrate-binding protein [Bacillus horti]